MPCIALLASALTLLAGALATPARAGPILNEVCYDGVGTDADEAFTEIHGTAGMSLAGWSLRAINGSNGSAYRTISLAGMSIQADGLLVLATSSATGAVLAARDYTASVDWQNGPDALQLLDPLGVIVDALQYGNAGLYNAGEGNFAPDVVAGWSLSRDTLFTDTNDNGNDFYALSTPTPGVGSTSAVPEPATLLLCGAGGLGLAAVRRRRSARSM